MLSLAAFPRAYDPERDISLWPLRPEDTESLFAVIQESGRSAINAPGAEFCPGWVKSAVDYAECVRPEYCSVRTVLPGVIVASGMYAGYIELASTARYVELLYWIGVPYRRCGIGVAAVRLATVAAHVAGITRTHLRIDPLNIASTSVARRAGYDYVGPIDDAYDEWKHDAPDPGI